jgi:hypothetical protein
MKRATVLTIMKPTEPFIAGTYSKHVYSGVIRPERRITGNIVNEFHPDFVFTDALFAYPNDRWYKLDCPKGMLIEDVHGKVPAWQIRIAHNLGIETIFHRFNESFFGIHKGIGEKYRCIWLPHSVDHNLYETKSKLRDKVLHIGKFDDGYYPTRTKVVNELSGWSEFQVIARPDETLGDKPKWPSGDDYINLVASAKMCVTGSSRYKAPLRKYFEIPACCTPLLTDWFKDLNDLGFVRDKHLIEYKDNILQQVQDLYHNQSDFLRQIAVGGRELILRRHTNSTRAHEFLTRIEGIINEAN